MPLPRLLPSLFCCPLPADPPSCRTFRVLVASHSCASAKTSFSVAFSWSSTAVCRHHGSRFRPPPSYPVSSLPQTSNIGRRATHCSTVDWRLSVYIHISCAPAAFRTLSAPSRHQVPSRCLLSRFLITCRKKTCRSPLSASPWPLTKPMSPP